ncbi:uncharacterized protein EV422DRAFT_622327 [Fimicolochytrium jonesii]|uniref:uncharacterized protein n=1 Tax=Fimicolochytrium jonesii TaxID=1396493 RepID=UPI0022FE19E9|nr:uncharacterized protein EV422DRAFT_622327 [Fimicolochytrium jonesii]KAI8817849.1 hypothetical protein EV422DRAFT_622327 [Fimicolochytrium jonesii]
MWDPYAAQQQQLAYGSVPDAQKTTLWMGDLEGWMEENYIRQLWASMGENVNVKMIRDKLTGQNAGYCFVDFMSNQAAMRHLTTINGTLIPGTSRTFKLNWASGGSAAVMGGARDDRGPEYSVFVGDLGPEVTDFMLLQTFQARYISCKSAKVVTDPVSGLTRGYGFVRFSDESEQQRALAEMQGQYCGSRAMRISPATPKSNVSGGSAGVGGAGFGAAGGMGGVGTRAGSVGAAGMAMSAGAGYYAGAGQAGGGGGGGYEAVDPTNTTVFVGGLTMGISDEELRSYFAPFGEIVYTRIPPNKGCGFVQYAHHQSAAMAIAQMNQYPIGGIRVRTSWGRSQAPARPPTGQYPSFSASTYPPTAVAYTSPYTATPYGAAPQPAYARQVEDPLQPVSVERMNEEFVRRKERIEEGEGARGEWRRSVIV